MQFETENVEFKSQMLEDLYKEIVAFANTDGGTVYIGIDNQGNKVIRIEVGEGASSAPASQEQIRQMIKTSDGDVFESMRSMEQELSFTEASAAFARYHVDFAEDKYITLGLRRLQDDLYTNLAWIVSDQCRHTIKVAVFGDDTNTIFKDHKEFSGSIFRQLDEAFSYLMLCNRTAAEFKGLERIDKPDYPEEALREALLNALVHRDYSFSGSIIINVNDSNMEFISIGGLLPGLSAEDIRNGISQPRNRNLAEIFHRLKLIESYGTGIRKIYHLYHNCAVQPRIEITPNTFKLILPNMNTAFSKEHTEPISAVDTVTPQMKTVLDYLTEYGEMTDEDFQELLGIKRTRAYILAKQMCEAGLIDSTGRGSTKRYRLKA